MKSHHIIKIHCKEINKNKKQKKAGIIVARNHASCKAYTNKTRI